MVQTTNRFFDEVARLMNDAAGVAQGVRREFETLFRSQAERILRDLAVVQREEFEAVKDMARLAREENEALKARIAALEARLGGAKPAARPACRCRAERHAGRLLTLLSRVLQPSLFFGPRAAISAAIAAIFKSFWHPWRLPRQSKRTVNDLHDEDTSWRPSI